jgi:tetratricopeptide (TPR) repeat protein
MTAKAALCAFPDNHFARCPVCFRGLFILSSSRGYPPGQFGESATMRDGESVQLLDHRLLGNQGNDLWLADRPYEALLPYRQAVQLAPAEPVLYRGLGNVLTDLGDFEAADRAYLLSRSLEDSPVTAWNHSQLLVGLERYEQAYALAERRWDMAEAEAWRDQRRAWRGESDGWQSPLLVWSEQGLGDTLQHLRWLGPLQLRRGAEAPPLQVEVEPCLVALLRRCLGHLPSPLQVRAKPSSGAPAPWDDFHVSLLSLPWLLGGAPVPDAAAWLQCSHWPEPAAAGAGTAPRVGVVWAAGYKLTNRVTVREYRRRSLDPEALALLLNGLLGLGWDVVLLQFGRDLDQAEPWRLEGMEALPADADFARTADWVAELDLVITVDTAMAHLVGAMRRPVWVLLPFSAAPRWLRHRSDSPWYPSLRLFRQPRSGDWRAVVDAVLCEAARHMGLHPPAGDAKDVFYDGRDQTEVD